MNYEFDTLWYSIKDNLFKNYSTADKMYNTGASARSYLEDSKIYQDKVNESLFRVNNISVADNYKSKTSSIDSIVSSIYTPIKPLSTSKSYADNYVFKDSKNLY